MPAYTQMQDVRFLHCVLAHKIPQNSRAETLGLVNCQYIPRCRPPNSKSILGTTNLLQSGERCYDNATTHPLAILLSIWTYERSRLTWTMAIGVACPSLSGYRWRMCTTMWVYPFWWYECHNDCWWRARVGPLAEYMLRNFDGNLALVVARAA